VLKLVCFIQLTPVSVLIYTEPPLVLVVAINAVPSELALIEFHVIVVPTPAGFSCTLQLVPEFSVMTVFCDDAIALVPLENVTIVAQFAKRLNPYGFESTLFSGIWPQSPELTLLYIL